MSNLGQHYETKSPEHPRNLSELGPGSFARKQKMKCKTPLCTRKVSIAGGPRLAWCEDRRRREEGIAIPEQGAGHAAQLAEERQTSTEQRMQRLSGAKRRVV